MSLAAFWTIVLIHLAAAISPGPSFVVSARSAATQGFQYGVALAVGFGLGALLWATVALAGISLVFELVPGIHHALKITGAGFLFYLAIRMWFSATEPVEMQRISRASRTKFEAFRLGFWVFATNPKPAVFFGAVFAGLVPTDAPLPWMAAIVSAVFINETGWYIIVARVFSLPRAQQIYLKMKTTFDRVFAGVLAILSIRLVSS